MKKVFITVLILFITAIAAFSQDCTCATGCSSITAISVPYSRDGIMDICLQSTCLGTSINSWNMDVVNINGQSFLNTWADSATFPAPINGYYYIYLKSSVSWAHFEIAGTCSTTTTAPTTPPGTDTVPPTTAPVVTIDPTTPPGTDTPGPTDVPTETPAPTATPGPTAVPTATPYGVTADPTAAPVITPVPTTPPGTDTPAPTLGPTTNPGTVYTGNATWFDNLGAPYGGCGIGQAYLDTQHFVALNVQNSPGDYTTFLSRPISSEYASMIGMFNNGLNCGRWVHVTIGDYCNGINDGAQNLPFCRDGTGWTSDAYNGAELDMIIADSCHDGNAWCRDDPYHVDLAHASLNQFVLNGVPVGDMDPTYWNNRQVSWYFIEAPNYSGDIKIGFIQSAQVWWPAIAITHLQNGIHGVDYYQNGSWIKASYIADMGQAFLIDGSTGTGSGEFRIRVYDVTDQLINSGRVYVFSIPPACGSSCTGPFTETTYTTE